MVVHRPVLLLFEGAVEASLAPRPALPGGGKSVVDTSAAALSAGAPAVAEATAGSSPGARPAFDDWRYSCPLGAGVVVMDTFSRFILGKLRRSRSLQRPVAVVARQLLLNSS